MRSRVAGAVALCLMLLSAHAAGAQGPQSDGADRVFTFRESLANIELVATSLSRKPLRSVTPPPAAAGDVWYGEILGRVEPKGDPKPDDEPLVAFRAVYDGGVAVAASWDAARNGDLGDDPSVKLYLYPPIEGARSFIAEVPANPSSDAAGPPPRRTVRIILEPPRDDRSPLYHVQLVHAMTGEMTLDGRTHRAFLHDGDNDGRYTTKPLTGDGIYVDLDDDGRIQVDRRAVEFALLAEPIHLGPGVYAVTSIDERGNALTLRRTGSEPWVDPPRVGRPAPDFSFTDTAGRSRSLAGHRGRWVLVYFWAAWCGHSRGQAGAIQALYEKHRPSGFEILGISVDNDKAMMEAFRAEHHETWPTSYSGIRSMKEPVAALYRPPGTGVGYLVAPDGTLEGIYEDAATLAGRLDQILTRSATLSR